MADAQQRDGTVVQRREFGHAVRLSVFERAPQREGVGRDDDRPRRSKRILEKAHQEAQGNRRREARSVAGGLSSDIQLC
jgi:hypothetical protein